MDTKSVTRSSSVNGLNQPQVSKEKLKADRDATQANKSGSNSKSDYGVEVSTKGQDIAQARARAMQIAKQTPDIREKKVAELRKRIQSGQYHADSAKIADGMLKEAVKDSLAMGYHNEAKRR